MGECCYSSICLFAWQYCNTMEYESMREYSMVLYGVHVMDCVHTVYTCVRVLGNSSIPCHCFIEADAGLFVVKKQLLLVCWSNMNILGNKRKYMCACQVILKKGEQFIDLYLIVWSVLRMPYALLPPFLSPHTKTLVYLLRKLPIIRTQVETNF